MAAVAYEQIVSPIEFAMLATLKYQHILQLTRKTVPDSLIKATKSRHEG